MASINQVPCVAFQKIEDEMGGKNHPAGRHAKVVYEPFVGHRVRILHIADKTIEGELMSVDARGRLFVYRFDRLAPMGKRGSVVIIAARFVKAIEVVADVAA